MCRETLVTNTKMACSICCEDLFRIVGPEGKDDQVLCIGCGGFGDYAAVVRGAGLIGNVVTQAQLNHMEESIAATAKKYHLNSL